MKQTFVVKNISVVVDYNPNIMTQKDVQSILNYAASAKTQETFISRYEDGFDILNLPQVLDALYFHTNIIQKTLDLTRYITFTNWMHQPFQVMLKQTYGINVISNAGGNKYLLEGPKHSFTSLKACL